MSSLLQAGDHWANLSVNEAMTGCSNMFSLLLVKWWLLENECDAEVKDRGVRFGIVTNWEDGSGIAEEQRGNIRAGADLKKNCNEVE